jgi:hypothetical protein
MSREALVKITMTILASIISGLVCGHFTISICESFFHRTIQHASPGLRHWYEKAGWLGQALLDAWYHTMWFTIFLHSEQITSPSLAAMKSGPDWIHD